MLYFNLKCYWKDVELLRIVADIGAESVSELSIELSQGYNYITTTTPHMSYLRPSYGLNNQEQELFEQILCGFIANLTLLIVTLYQLCMHILLI